MATTPEAAPRIGIAPDSWGVWNPEDPVQPPPEQYLREVPMAGFHYTELGPWGYLGTDPNELKDLFAANDLALSGGTFGTSLHRGKGALEEAWTGIKPVAEAVVALGANHLITLPEMWQRDDHGEVIGSRAFSTQEWDAFLSGHDELGRRLLEEYGLRQEFHSHAESQVGSWSEVTRLLEGTDPRYTNLCLDTGHFAYYLGDSVELIKAYPERIGYLHLKQVDPILLGEVLKNDIDFATAVTRGVMAEAPLGAPDLAPVLAEAAATTPGIFAIVEQDLYPVPSFDLPLQIATRTHQYLTTCGIPVRTR